MTNEAEPVFTVVASKDAELRAMRTVLQAIDDLRDVEARRRVLDYVRDRVIPPIPRLPFPRFEREGVTDGAR